MSLILDSSAALAYCFDDERSTEIDALIASVARKGAIVPSLWFYEMSNVLSLALRRGRITAAYRGAMFDRFRAMPIDIDAESDSLAWSATTRLADLYKLTAYDAAYLELAQRRRLPLATLDDALANAARSAGVETLGR